MIAMRSTPLRKTLRGVKLPKPQSIRPHCSFHRNREPQNNPIDPQIPPPKDETTTPILTLSNEVLHMIFWYLVPSRRWIPTYTLPRNRRTSKRNKTNQTQTPLLLLTHSLFAVRLTNKTFYEIASSIYYKTNTFVLGNGPWGSTANPNLHGLKQFIRTIPSSHRDLIKTIRLGIYVKRDSTDLLGYNDFSNPLNPAFYFDSWGTAYLARVLGAHLRGVQDIRFYIAEPFPRVSRNERWEWFIGHQCWESFVKCLISCKEVRRFLVLDKNESLRRSLEKVIDETPYGSSWKGVEPQMKRVVVEVV